MNHSNKSSFTTANIRPVIVLVTTLCVVELPTLKSESFALPFAIMNASKRALKFI